MKKFFLIKEDFPNS